MSDYLASYKSRQNLSASDDSDVDRRLIELSALFEISQTLNSSLNLQAILNNILLVPMGRMMLGKGVILIKNSDTQYSIETTKGLPHGLIGKIIHIADLPQHPFFLKDISEESEWKTFFNEFKIELLIPFVSRTDVLGLMGFSRKR